MLDTSALKIVQKSQTLFNSLVKNLEGQQVQKQFLVKRGKNLKNVLYFCLYRKLDLILW